MPCRRKACQNFKRHFSRSTRATLLCRRRPSRRFPLSLASRSHPPSSFQNSHLQQYSLSPNLNHSNSSYGDLEEDSLPLRRHCGPLRGYNCYARICVPHTRRKDSGRYAHAQLQHHLVPPGLGHVAASSCRHCRCTSCPNSGFPQHEDAGGVVHIARDVNLPGRQLETLTSIYLRIQTSPRCNELASFALSTSPPALLLASKIELTSDSKSNFDRVDSIRAMVRKISFDSHTSLMLWTASSPSPRRPFC